MEKKKAEGSDSQMNFTVDHTKSGIIIDHLLKEYGQSFAENMIELDDIKSSPDKNIFCVCRLTEGEMFQKMPMHKLVWGHQFSEKALSGMQLKEMTFINNLDSVLDYDTFELPLMFLFPLLECIRRHPTAKNMYMVGNAPEGTVYLSMH